jgi:hypothetical protein
MAEAGNGRLASRQAMFREQLGNRAVGRALLPQFGNDLLGRKQILELARPARCKVGDRLADCGWIKYVHRLDGFGPEPGNWSAARRIWASSDADISWPVQVRE